MATTVFVRHRDGRRIQVGGRFDSDQAAKVKREVERRFSKSESLMIASADGRVEEITPRSVVALELIEDPDG